MMLSKTIFATRPLLIAGALFALCAPAFAQSSNETNQLLNRLNQLETQMQTVSRAVFRGTATPVSGAPVADNAASAAAFDARLSQIEEQQRNLTGQIEKISFELQKLKDTVERQRADTEQRFAQAAQTPVPVVPETAPVAETPSGTLGSLSSAPTGAEAMYERAFADIKAAKYAEAETGFKRFLDAHPAHALASNAQYWLGETYYVRADYKQAARTFALCYQQYPKSAKAADSLLKLGLSLSKLGKKEDACLSLRQLQQDVTDAANALRKRGDQEIKQLACP